MLGLKTGARRWMWLAAAAVAAVALLLGVWAATSRTPTAATAASPALPEQQATAGPVTVEVTPERVDTDEAVFAVVLDNHEVDLTGDYGATSTLTVTGTPWADARWSGDGPGGHHREGTLTFSPPGTPPDGAALTGELTLVLGGLPEPVTLRWALPDAGS